MDHEYDFDTLAVNDPSKENADTGDIVDPIHLSTTFEIDPDEGFENQNYTYRRIGNPTRETVESTLATIEGANHAVATSSGMTAISTVCLAVLSQGDNLVAGESLFSGTKKMFDEVLSSMGIEVRYVDATETENVASAIDNNTGLVWMESPTNPLLKLYDIRGIAEIVDGRDGVTFAVDNTFNTPYVQRPLELGADVVVYSATKFLNGHSDVTGGAVVTDHEELDESFRFVAEDGLGAVLSPQEAYLLRRGLKTLPLRMERHLRNAEAVAEFLDDHSKIDTVHYPGLESHPQHGLAKEQMEGFGGVVSFEIDGEVEDVEKFLKGLDVFNIAVSLGAVESLIEHTASMSGYKLEPEERRDAGISDSLVRAPIGIENTDDLIRDLERGISEV